MTSLYGLTDIETKTDYIHCLDPIVRVDPGNVSGNVTGQTWDSSFTTLQAAVDRVQIMGGGEVWVKACVYTSTTGPIVTMKEGVSLYGGFAGTETTRDQRDWTMNVTIIDGEDTRLCVAGANDAAFDGFTVKRAGDEGGFYYGGGMENTSVSPTIRNCVFTLNSKYPGISNFGCAPSVEYCSFINNSCDDNPFGGAMLSLQSSPTIQDCVFTSNVGAAVNFQDACYPTITRCVFTFNSNLEGPGGAILGGSPTITDCEFTSNLGSIGSAIWGRGSGSVIKNSVFTGNQAKGGGGALYVETSLSILNCEFVQNTAWDGGAILVTGASASPTISNCYFQENTATPKESIYAPYIGSAGGAICSVGISAMITNCVFAGNSALADTWDGLAGQGGAVYINSSATLINCSFAGNSAKSVGGAIAAVSVPYILKNCILYGNTTELPDYPEIYDLESTPTITYSCVQGGVTGTGNTAEDPLYVDGVDGGNGFDLHLQSGSPCADTGASLGAPPKDIEGVLRPQGSGVDMGAYER